MNTIVQLLYISRLREVVCSPLPLFFQQAETWSLSDLALTPKLRTTPRVCWKERGTLKGLLEERLLDVTRPSLDVT